MATSKVSSSPPSSSAPAAPAASAAWKSLVARSVSAMGVLAWNAEVVYMKSTFAEALQACSSLDDFLTKIAARESMMFWFFQKRSAFFSQKRMTKWSPDCLDDYILLPAIDGFASRSECFFISHFWRTKEHPDPDGKCVRSLQKGLRGEAWSYIWVDWTCTPQSPRSEAEEAYFILSLKTMSGIIRHSAFLPVYETFEPRLWILYELAEFGLTSIGGIPADPGLKDFMSHILEMKHTGGGGGGGGGVRQVLDKYGYNCSLERDKAFLISSLELLFLLNRLPVGMFAVRSFLDSVTQAPWLKNLAVILNEGILELKKAEGILVYNGVSHSFTPFPEMTTEKDSAKKD